MGAAHKCSALWKWSGASGVGWQQWAMFLGADREPLYKRTTKTIKMIEYLRIHRTLQAKTAFERESNDWIIFVL